MKTSAAQHTSSYYEPSLKIFSVLSSSFNLNMCYNVKDFNQHVYIYYIYMYLYVYIYCVYIHTQYLRTIAVSSD